MGRIADAFARADAEGRAALIVYLCAGDPDLALTPSLVLAAAAAGADIVELGMPFSDPTADGVVIQRASERALRAGATLDGVLDAAARVRATSDVPLILFGYINPLLTRGEARVVEQAKGAGIDGFLVVDAPPEECASLRDPAVEAGLDWIPLVAPTSTDARIDRASAVATSFLYSVALTGVTGARAPDLEVAARRAAAIRARTNRPIAVGFGIKSPEDVRAVARFADGVVVGSALVLAVHEALGADAKVARAGELVRSLRAASPRG